MKAFLFSKRAGRLSRALSARNLSPLKSVGAESEDMVETMRKNLEDYASSHAASQTEEMIARMRIVLDEVATKPGSSAAGTPQKVSSDLIAGQGEQLPLATSHVAVNNHIHAFGRLGESVVLRHLPRQTSARLAFDRIKRTRTIPWRRRSLNDDHNQRIS